MKNIYSYILVFLTAFLVNVGCQEIYLDEYDELALDYTQLTLEREGGKFAFMVYYSGDWQITLDKEVEWAQFEMTSGSGVTPVHINVDENYTFQRTFNMIISAGDQVDTVSVMQRAAVDVPLIKFAEDSLAIANGSGRVTVILKSNLSIEAINPQSIKIDYMDSDAWMQNFEVEQISDDYVVENGTAVYSYRVMFDLGLNDSGAERTAYLKFELFDENGQSYGSTMPLTQGVQNGEIIVRDHVVKGAGKNEYVETISGGLERYQDMMTARVSENDFIENVYVADGRIYYTLNENTSSESREAEITVVYGDNLLTRTITLVQREAGIGNVYSIASAQDLLEWNNDAANWSATDLVILESDIDCSGVVDSDNWKMNIFKGTFEGNNHVIDNFVIAKECETAFFARIIDEARVSDLTFGPGCSFTALKSSSSLNNNTYAASLTAFAGGNASFLNVINKGKVSVSDKATDGAGGNFTAGICGYFNSKGSITACVNEGTVTNNAAVKDWTCLGGIVGCLAVAADEVVLTENKNLAPVINTAVLASRVAMGGIVGRLDKTSLVLESCVNTGDIINSAGVVDQSQIENKVPTDIYMSALLGVLDKSATSAMLTFTNCVAEGTITNDEDANPSKTAIGGFVGFCYSNNITGCNSSVKIINKEKGSVFIGGFAGQIEGTDPISTVVANCSANVEITSEQTGYTGVIIGRLTYDPTSTKTVSVTNVNVAGVYNGTVLDEYNYLFYSYGSSGAVNNNYRPTDGLIFN